MWPGREEKRMKSRRKWTAQKRGYCCCCGNELWFYGPAAWHGGSIVYIAIIIRDRKSHRSSSLPDQTFHGLEPENPWIDVSKVNEMRILRIWNFEMFDRVSFCPFFLKLWQEWQRRRHWHCFPNETTKGTNKSNLLPNNVFSFDKFQPHIWDRHHFNF